MNAQAAELFARFARADAWEVYPEVPDVLAELPRRMTVEYYRRGRTIITRSKDNHSLFVLRAGAVEVRDANGTLVVNGSIEVYPCQTNVVDTSTVAGVSINHAVMFGPGMVGYAPTAEGVRIARANEDNYGEDNLVQWICYEGAAVLDGRFAASAHSD